MGAVNRTDLQAVVGAPCPYCGFIMERRGNHPTRDRIIPGHRGGTYAPRNVEIVCQTCNNDKGQLSLVAFHAALAVENDHRAGRVAAVIAERKAKGLPV